MQMNHDEEFRKSFMADDEMPAEHMAEAGADEDMVSDNVPAEGAAEGIEEGGGDVAAVTLEAPAAEEGGESIDDDSDVPPEDKQAYRTWRGRLKKYEQELKARDAALAERAQSAESALPAAEMPAPEGADEVPALAEGGEVTGDAAPEEPSGEPDMLAELEADYGADFVQKLVAVVRREIESGAKPYVESVQADLSGLVNDVIGAFRSMNRAQVAEAHEDFEDIVGSEAFGQWIESLPEDAKARAQQVVEGGTPGQIIKLLTQFKDAQKQPAEAADPWAEDAAAGVKSSAPLRIPSRAPASPDDEYRSAWAQL